MYNNTTTSSVSWHPSSSLATGLPYSFFAGVPVVATHATRQTSIVLIEVASHAPQEYVMRCMEDAAKRMVNEVPISLRVLYPPPPPEDWEVVYPEEGVQQRQSALYTLCAPRMRNMAKRVLFYTDYGGMTAELTVLEEEAKSRGCFVEQCTILH